jgi:D-alanyl-lipoteichoic acid acyltransferase DltB (MBOAT superfamily)
MVLKKNLISNNMKKDIIFCTSPDPKDDQIRVILNPKDSYYSFDCVRLSLKQMDGELQTVDMTPDEEGSCERLNKFS